MSKHSDNIIASFFLTRPFGRYLYFTHLQVNGFFVFFLYLIDYQLWFACSLHNLLACLLFFNKYCLIKFYLLFPVFTNETEFFLDKCWIHHLSNHELISRQREPIQSYGRREKSSEGQWQKWNIPKYK